LQEVERYLPPPPKETATNDENPPTSTTDLQPDATTIIKKKPEQFLPPPEMLFEEIATNDDDEPPFTITGLQPNTPYATYRLHHSAGAAFVTEAGIGTSICFFRFAESVDMTSDRLARKFLSSEPNHNMFDMCIRPTEMWVLSAGRVFYAGPTQVEESEDETSE
jgi:hypothetical protein